MLIWSYLAIQLTNLGTIEIKFLAAITIENKDPDIRSSKKNDLKYKMLSLNRRKKNISHIGYVKFFYTHLWILRLITRYIDSFMNNEREEMIAVEKGSYA